MTLLLLASCATLGALLGSVEQEELLEYASGPDSDVETLYSGEPTCVRGTYTVYCDGCEPAWGPVTVPFDCLMGEDQHWNLRFWNSALPGGIAEWRDTRPGVDMRAEYIGDP